MDYKLCSLYGLKSKKRLIELLHIDKKSFCRSSFVSRNIHPYIASNENGKRLVEAPSEHLKAIQRKILGHLQKLDYPEYLHSGVKKKSYITNARAHKESRYVFKVDISKFFPNTSRDRIYLFFRHKLNTSPDVAEILTNFCSYDCAHSHKKEINDYIQQTSINQYNHLITGGPVSTILAYLANVDMFDELYSKARNFGIKMTVYVDDIVFSSNSQMPYFFRNEIIETIRQFGYNVSPNKCRWYNIDVIKKIAGVYLDGNQKLCVPFRLMKKTHAYIEELKTGNFDNAIKLMGCINVIEQIRSEETNYKKQIQSKIKRDSK